MDVLHITIHNFDSSVKFEISERDATFQFCGSLGAPILKCTENDVEALRQGFYRAI